MVVHARNKPELETTFQGICINEALACTTESNKDQTSWSTTTKPSVQNERDVAYSQHYLREDYLEGEFGVVHAHPVPEPDERGVDEVEQGDKGDEVDGDVGHQLDGLGRAVGGRLDDVALRPAWTWQSGR